MTQPYFIGQARDLVIFTSGRSIAQSVGQVVIGQADFDPTLLPDGGRSLLWEVVIASSDAAVTAEIELFNITAGAIVTGSQLLSNSLAPDILSSTLTVPGDIPAGLRRYEVRLNLDVQPGTEFVTCWSAVLKAQWS